VLIAAIEAEVGTRDEYGDHPAAGGIALMVMAAIMIIALVALARSERALLIEVDAGRPIAINGATP
jgi:hypothetical protein